MKIKPVKAWVAVNKLNGELALGHVASHRFGVVHDLKYFGVENHAPVQVEIRPVTKKRKRGGR